MQQPEFDRQNFNAELDDMIARKEIECGSLIAQAIADYQKNYGGVHNFNRQLSR